MCRILIATRQKPDKKRLPLVLVQRMMILVLAFATTRSSSRRFLCHAAAWTTSSSSSPVLSSYFSTSFTTRRPAIKRTSPRWTTITKQRPRIASSSTKLFLSTASSSNPQQEKDQSDTTIDDDNDDDIAEQRKRKKEMAAKAKAAAREKRKKMIGLAKAVDRGQYAVTYQPGGVDGKSFIAKSGLPSLMTDDNKLFTVLGIESSCDDTGAAIVRSDGTILGESLASQHEVHEEWGGVVPGLARDAHVSAIDTVIREALRNANMTNSIARDIDAIGVTIGPGLEICLRVGCEKARQLAIKYNKPFVGVHHLEAHVLMARLPIPIPIQQQQQQQPEDNIDNSSSKEDGATSNNTAQETETTKTPPTTMDFPFLALLVSGGHCQLMLCRGIGRYEILGGTLDDSLGEAYDKTARLLGLKVGGGGGPAIEQLAKQGNPKSIAFSVPLQASRRSKKDCNFSYSGLKTNVKRVADQLIKERNVNSVEELPLVDKANIAASFQNVAIKHIEQRLNRAMDQLEDDYSEDDADANTKRIRTFALVGGVAANEEIRSRLQVICSKRNYRMFVPPPRLCTDQGTMSAWAAVERLLVGSSDDPTNQEVYARFPFSVSNNSNPNPTNNKRR